MIRFLKFLGWSIVFFFGLHFYVKEPFDNAVLVGSLLLGLSMGILLGKVWDNEPSADS